MAKPFDATLKHLLEAYPQDWVRLLGLQEAGPVQVLDADLATITAEADKVFRLGEPNPWLLHLELQSSYDPRLGQRSLRYNVLLESRHELPVQSILILLRPEADGREMNGRVRRQLPNGRPYLEFEYDVVRVWQLPAESILQSGLGTLPLAPLATVSDEALPRIIQRMEDRFSHEAGPGEAASLWTAAYVLMGLKYPREFAAQLLKGVRAMKESTTYQAILEEGEVKGLARGRAEEARRILLALGKKRLGPPDARVQATVQAIADVDHLEQLTERLLDVSSWQELLA